MVRVFVRDCMRPSQRLAKLGDGIGFRQYVTYGRYCLGDADAEQPGAEERR
jgi:hypothetical protein